MPLPGSPLLPTCGVGNCTCGGLADLPGSYSLARRLEFRSLRTCVAAQDAQDMNICRNVKQPMCALSGESTSGVQFPLLAAAVGSTATWVL